MHGLLFLDPGHFHAALTLRAVNPRVACEIHLYAPEGAQARAFADLVENFNGRAEAPTNWELAQHLGPDSLARLIAERLGDIVVLAGRNDTKLTTIRALREAGFQVLVDKPWLTNPSAISDLEAVTTPGPPLAVDIMTSRHIALARLRQRLVAMADFFGDFDVESGGPAIEQTSRHHIHKLVNGKPLRRPDWYFDSRVQGDGLVDIQSHLVDQAQWLVATRHGQAAECEVEAIQARRWATPVDRELYRQSAGTDVYPPLAEGVVVDDVLNLNCNGIIDARIGPVPIRMLAEWGAREPEGGGDQLNVTVRGTGARIVFRQGPDTGHKAELVVAPGRDGDFEARLRSAISALVPEFPGLATDVAGDGFRLSVDPDLDGGHESHFPLVLDEFLDLLAAPGGAESLTARIRARYRLLAEAQGIAEDVPSPPDVA